MELCSVPIHGLQPLLGIPTSVQLQVQLAVRGRRLSKFPHAPALVQLLTVIPQLLYSRLDLALDGLKLLSSFNLHTRSTWNDQKGVPGSQRHRAARRFISAKDGLCTSCFTICSKTEAMDSWAVTNSRASQHDHVAPLGCQTTGATPYVFTLLRDFTDTAGGHQMVLGRSADTHFSPLCVST